MTNLFGREPKCVLILELGAAGHHPTYVRWLLESKLAESSHVILAAQKEMFAHPAIRSCTATFTSHEIVVPPGFEARLKSVGLAGLIRTSWEVGRLYRRTFALLSRTRQIDFVVVPYLEHCLVGLALPREPFGKVPWITITMRTMFHFDDVGVIAPVQKFRVIRRRLFCRALKQKTLTAVLTIDPTLVDYSKNQDNPIFSKVEYLPDPATDHGVLPSKVDTRWRLNIPASARVVLLYGEIGARKGVLTLLEAAADPACPSDVHIVLAGRCHDQTLLRTNTCYQQLLAQGRVHRMDGYLDDNQERDILAASDCMWVGYTEFYLMSGIMVLAARNGIPVLASASGLIGYLTKLYQTGLILDPHDRLSVVAALTKLVREPEFFSRAAENGIRMYDVHRPEELQRLVTEKALVSWNQQP